MIGREERERRRKKERKKAFPLPEREYK
jgi:hypothetical protein